MHHLIFPLLKCEESDISDEAKTNSTYRPSNMRSHSPCMLNVFPPPMFPVFNAVTLMSVVLPRGMLGPTRAVSVVMREKSFNETVRSTSQKNIICLTFTFNIIGIVCTNFPCVNTSGNIVHVANFRHRSSWNLDRQRVTKRKVKQWSSEQSLQSNEVHLF